MVCIKIFKTRITIYNYNETLLNTEFLSIFVDFFDKNYYIKYIYISRLRHITRNYTNAREGK